MGELLQLSVHVDLAAVVLSCAALVTAVSAALKAWQAHDLVKRHLQVEQAARAIARARGSRSSADV